MDSVTKTLILLNIFILWNLAGIVFYLYQKPYKPKFTKTGWLRFFLYGIILATVRSLAFWYLCYQMRYHTVIGVEYPLQWFVLPEATIVGETLNVGGENLFLTVVYLALILGSFLWTMPLLFFSSKCENKFR